MTTPVSAANTASAAITSTAASQTSAATGAVDKTMFLRLLVEQVKNQDPLNPADGVQFLTQLAQFQQLEQNINMGQDVSAIRQSLESSQSA